MINCRCIVSRNSFQNGSMYEQLFYYALLDTLKLDLNKVLFTYSIKMNSTQDVMHTLIVYHPSEVHE